MSDDPFKEFDFVGYDDADKERPFWFRTGCGCCDGDCDLDNARAERLAIALVQSTPGGEADFCIKHYSNGEPYIYIPDDVSGTYGVSLSMDAARELGLALIRAAGRATR